ncbi:hypothetical protein NEAUS03_2267 [Nematocida ausubeli]|nr:hypothetical protein NEAUS03_2267 [Nematocida ausubeli]
MKSTKNNTEYARNNKIITCVYIRQQIKRIVLNEYISEPEILDLVKVKFLWPFLKIYLTKNMHRYDVLNLLDAFWE